MTDRPELPTTVRSRAGAFSVIPDERPMRWTVWDLDGCVGEISLDGERWVSHPEHQAAETHETWQKAVDRVVSF